MPNVEPRSSLATAGIYTASALAAANVGLFAYYAVKPNSYIKNVQYPYYKMVKSIFPSGAIHRLIAIPHGKFIDQAMLASDAFGKKISYLTISYPWRHIAWAAGAAGVAWLIAHFSKPEAGK